MPNWRKLVASASSNGRALSSWPARRYINRFVEIRNCEQWAAALLLEYFARARKPLRRFFIAPLQGAQPGQGQATIAHRIAEIRN